MAITIKGKIEVPVTTLHVSAGVRYWEDTTVNGFTDTEGNLIPFRNGENWEPVINLATGKIKDWPAGTTASVHYKVCDDGTYTLKDVEGNTVKEIQDYVPELLCPAGGGYGDYIIMEIEMDGTIQDFDPVLEEFDEGES